MSGGDFTIRSCARHFRSFPRRSCSRAKAGSEGFSRPLSWPLTIQLFSKMATPGNRRSTALTAVAPGNRQTLAQYADLKDIIAMLGLEQLSPQDRKVVGRARGWSVFSRNPFSRRTIHWLKGKLSA